MQALGLSTAVCRYSRRPALVGHQRGAGGGRCLPDLRQPGSNSRLPPIDEKRVARQAAAGALGWFRSALELAALSIE